MTRPLNATLRTALSVGQTIGEGATFTMGQIGYAIEDVDQTRIRLREVGEFSVCIGACKTDLSLSPRNCGPTGSTNDSGS